MSTRRLRRIIEELEQRRVRHRELGDDHGADELDVVIAKAHLMADELDDVLKRLGNPPTD